MTGTFEGVGSLQFSPDNKLAYAYSGVLSPAGTELDMLNIKTESEYIEGSIQTVSGVEVSDNYEFTIYFNDVAIWKQRLTNTVQLYPYGMFPVLVVIPPFTEVRATLENLTSDTGREWNVSLTGSVHGAIQQENLEAISNNNKWAKL